MDLLVLAESRDLRALLECQGEMASREIKVCLEFLDFRGRRVTMVCLALLARRVRRECQGRLEGMELQVMNSPCN